MCAPELNFLDYGLPHFQTCPLLSVATGEGLGLGVDSFPTNDLRYPRREIRCAADAPKYICGVKKSITASGICASSQAAIM